MTKVHPTPKKRNITLIRYDVVSSADPPQKKLLRLPHVFCKVLELPFHSNADVSIQETPDSLRFSAPTSPDDFLFPDDVTARVIEIHPGVTKIVVILGNNNNANGGGDGVAGMMRWDELGIDLWRFRLPECTMPEMASAVYRDGELVVVVPKLDEADPSSVRLMQQRLAIDFGVRFTCRLPRPKFN